MSTVNKVILIGFVGQDPEVRSVRTGGAKMATISLATSKRWKDKESGERKEKTEWHRVVVFNDALADVVGKYVRKSARIYVEGELATRKWQDDKGVDRYSTEVVLNGFNCKLELLDKREGGGDRAPPAEDYEQYGKTQSKPATVSPLMTPEDEDQVPF